MTTAPAVVVVVSDRRRLATSFGGAIDGALDLLLEQASAASDAGADVFHLREPDLDAAALLPLVKRLTSVVRGRLRLVVNDRADIAAVAGVGVHLRHSSVAADRLRAWLPTGTFVTRAVHTADEVRRAGPVDAIVAGTVARTPSKTGDHPTLGMAGLAALVRHSAVPVYAIGGIAPHDWPWIAETGAAGCAGIGAFLPRSGESVREAVFRAVAAFRGAR
jgi:thiamine-phosphate diphosphorylase